MSKRTGIALTLLGLLAASVPATYAGAAPSAQAGPMKIAVYGDSPYGRSAYAPGGQSGDVAQFQQSPAFIGTINGDASLSEVLHVGDIHSGKEFCTAAYDD